jgi:serine protease Do
MCRLPLRSAVVLAIVLTAIPAVQAANPRRTPVVDVVERVKAAVVNIHSERMAAAKSAEEFFATSQSQNRINGMGTGIIIDPRGYIVTNHHVVEDVGALRVRLCDGTTVAAHTVARDPENDLALIKIETSKPLPVIPLGTANDLMVGETVIAIGNAYGYEHSVTVGVVSAIKRDVTLNKDMAYKSLIQTDASINPGNSGGPLLNINGELIGVNVAIRAGAQGIGFAIPVDTMIRVTADLISIRKLATTWHGVVARDVVAEEDKDTGKQADKDAVKGEAQTAANSAALCLRPRRSLIVDRIEPESPAAKAELQRGDQICRIGDLPITCTLELERAFLGHTSGEHVPVVVRRNGAEQRLDLVLQSVEKPTSIVVETVWRRLGLRLQAVSNELVSRAHGQLHGGLSIAEVRSDSPAAKAGLQRGDILVGLDRWETLTLENVMFVLNSPEATNPKPVQFYIIRAGRVHQGWLQHGE